MQTHPARYLLWILGLSCVTGIATWALSSSPSDAEAPRAAPERMPVGVLTLHGCVSGVCMGALEPSSLVVEVGPVTRRFELREGLALDDLAVLIQDDFAAQSVRVTTAGDSSLVFGLPHADAQFGIDGNDRTLRCTIELSQF